MNPAILRIKAAAPLPVVAGEYIKLRKMGKDLLGLCPFHSEHTPSFHVHADYFKCFGCGAAGDVVTFISRIEAISPGAALRFLSERTGISLDPQSPPRTRLQRAYDAQELAFAEWWWTDQVSMRGLLMTAALEAEWADDEWLGQMSGDLIALRAAPRSQRRALAERCATADDRQEWARIQSCIRRVEDAIRASA